MLIHAQTGTLVFNDTLMHTIKIEPNLPNWFDTLEADYKANLNIKGHPQRYFYCKISFDGFKLDSCGFKEKGNASNSLISYGKKKPLKLSFDEFKNQELNGLKKLNLNNFTNDPSLLHDVISFKLMRDIGVFAPRTAFAKLFVNNEFIGLNVIIENVDKTFLKSKFGGSKNDGNLYKTDRNAQMFLQWLGEDKEAYKNKNFQLTTNETADDWSKFIDFVNFINHDNSADFFQQFEKRFDVHNYLKILAVEKCVKSWDSYWGGGNNYFLYEHPDGMMRWIPWDMNETFQDVKVLHKTSLLDGYLIPTPQLDKRPLIKRIFENEIWKNEYLNNVCELINHEFTIDHLGKFILKRHALIDSSYQADPFKYNSYNDFKISLTETNEDVVSITKSGYALRIRYPGIFPFIQEQRRWAQKQLNGWNMVCDIQNNEDHFLSIYPNPANDYVNIKPSNNGFDYSQIMIYNSAGELVLYKDFALYEGPVTKVDLSELTTGFYIIVKHKIDGSIGRAKLLIKK